MKSNQNFSNHQKNKCFFSWVLVILFFIVIPVFSQPQKGWVPFSTGKADKPTKSYMKDETTSGMLVNFDVPGMFVYDIKKDGTVYQRLTIPGKGTTTEIGKPELPVIGEVLEVPHGVDFKVEIYKFDYKVLDGYEVYPYQPPPIDEDENSEFKKDETTYSTDTFYPKELALITSQDIAIIRGHRIVLLKANPIQYNPVTKQLKVYLNLEARIKYSNPAQIRKIDRRLISKSFEELMERTVLNYKKVNRFDWVNYEKSDRYLKVGRLASMRMIDINDSYWNPGNAAMENFDDDDDDNNNISGCEYLIITTNTFYNDADPNNPVLRLRNWKRQKGLSTEVVLLQDIPDSDNDTDIDEEDISSYIKDAYNTWSPPPTYILLIGDAGDNAGNPIIPTHYKSTDSSHNNTLRAADIYFVTVDGNDYFPDIFLGRLSVDTQAQAGDVIDKIIDYERNPPGAANAAFYTDAALIALFEDVGVAEDGIEDRPWIETVEEIRTYLINNGYNVDRVYNTSAVATNPQQYENGTALPADLLVANGFQWNGGANDIGNAINNGRFLVTYRAHGGQDRWGEPTFTNINVNNLINGNLTPVVISLTCQAGWFDNESDDDANLDPAEQTGNNDECFCEHFLRHNNGGAVAIIGASRNSKTGYNDFLGFGCYKAIWPDFDPNPPFAAGYPNIPDITSGPLYRIGQVMTFGKIFMANAYADSTSRKESFEEYLVFGDPEMPIWTEMPVNLSVHHPAGIGSTGTQDFVVKVKDQANDPVNNAIVCLTRDGEIISSRMTDAGGIARFTRNFSSGNLDITVTALGFRPYTGIIEVTANGAQLNRLDPDNGIKGQPFNVGGKNFSGNENIRIYLDDQQMLVHQASADEFGQLGVEDVPVTIPNNFENGLYNVILEGVNSGRFAVDVFQVRDQNPVDLYTYSQWDDTTWVLHPGDNPTWNNPEIQLYDENNVLVQSNNLTVGKQYRIVAKIYNSSNFNAQNVNVTFKWANYGAAQKTWNVIDTDQIDVSANNIPADAIVMWAPPITGHLCLRVFIRSFLICLFSFVKNVDNKG